MKLSDADMKKLAETLAAVQDADSAEAGGRTQGLREGVRAHRQDGQARALSRVARGLDRGLLLDAARSRRRRAASDASRRRRSSATFAGKPVEFHYGLILPNGFDIKKRYPLIVALHDKGAAKDDKVSGPRSTSQEVWMPKTLPKEERDKFIIIAPTMGTGVRRQGAPRRVGRHPPHHERLPARSRRCSRSTRSTTTGSTSTAPVRAASSRCSSRCYKPHVWAAVAARSALPRALQLLAERRLASDQRST